MTDKYFNSKKIFQYKVINPQNIPFSQAVADACAANLCGKYGTCWTCPPGVGNRLELEKRIKSYKQAIVFTCKYELEDSFDFDGMKDGGKKTAALLREITDAMRKDGIDFMALGCEGCLICEKCTYPDSPCRFPNRAIPSIEACGVDVVALAASIGINYNNGPNTVTYFCAVLT